MASTIPPNTHATGMAESSPPTPQSSSFPSCLVPAPPLSSSRYNRQLLLPQLRLQGQEHLLGSKVLVIGLGGLGCPAALYLAGAGIGTLGLMDGDTVELGNLHRQIAHTESAARSGLPKVQSAAARCRELNSDINYVLHPARASAENILDIVARYDLVLDCTDNPATRYLISDACVILGKVLVSGAAQRGEGTVVVLNSPPTSSQSQAVDSTGATEMQGKGPCYRCVFPRPPPPEMVRGCSEIGILGPVVGAIGTLMAGEAIKLVVAGAHLPHHRVPVAKSKPQPTMLLYNTYSADPRGVFRTITLRGRRKDCLACGDDEALARKSLTRITADVIARGSLDYQAFCGVLEDVRVLGKESRIEAGDFLGEQRREEKGLVIDVREEHEYELGAKVRGSLNIPLSRILRRGDAFDSLISGGGPVESGFAGQDLNTDLDLDQRERGQPTSIYFVCQRGNDSQIAAQKLIERIASARQGKPGVDGEIDAAPTTIRSWGWIGDVKGGFVAMERYANANTNANGS